MHLPAATDFVSVCGCQADVVAASLCLASHVRDGETTISHGGSLAGRGRFGKKPPRAAGGQREAAGQWGEPSAAHAGGGVADDAIRRTDAAPRL